MELSYTQNLEDYHLALAFRDCKVGTYIDIGGGHPIADNVSFWFYERGWRGVVVEPLTELAALYERLRPRDVILRDLVGERRGESEFYVVDRLHGLSTTIAQHAQLAGELGASYRVERRPITTLAEICERHSLVSVDFLKIDVEGGEGAVLRGGDWKRFRPGIVVAEAVTPGSGQPSWHDWEPFLIAQGYRFVLFDTLNRFYVAEERQDLLARLPSERQPWHTVRHMYEIGRAPENQDHPDHELAKDLARGFWASLPHLDREFIKSMLLGSGRAKYNSESTDLRAMVQSEAFTFSLGRIACGYDGGQITAD
jgi:FkbM family methyltransferase